ncbi:MAG TPA: single-stranded DNA-binding protein [Solirubrobacterales bacterium]|nr:single-stranded DNA-binding protein [Solirubrobacterales bacterium]
MNNISLIGNLTRDPELRRAAGGAVCAMRIAVDNPGRGGTKGEPTYVGVATFGNHAESCATHLAKGRQVAVSGRLVFREWEAKDGSKRSAHEVRGSVQFLDRKPEGLVVAGRGEAEEPIPF